MLHTIIREINLYHVPTDDGEVAKHCVKLGVVKPVNTEVIVLANIETEMEESLEEQIASLRKHVAALHGEIQSRDRQIEELEAEVKIKEAIIRKQAVMMVGE